MTDKIISIDCGGTNLRVAAMDKELNILAVRIVPSIKDDPMALYNKMKELIDIVKEEAHMDYVESIGMSMCGVVMNNQVGRVGNLGIDSFDFVSLFNRDFPTAKLYFANDANCSALVEAEYGANKGFLNSAFVTISTGIGLGVVHNGEMIDLPLEGGRMFVNYKGKDYEAEYLLSGNGTVHLAALNDIEITSAYEFFQGVRAKDEKMIALYHIWIDMLATWFSNLQLLFNVDSYAVSGGVMKSKDIFFEDLERLANEKIATWNFKPIVLKYASFTQDVGLAGGGALAWHALKK